MTSKRVLKMSELTTLSIYGRSSHALSCWATQTYLSLTKLWHLASGQVASKNSPKGVWNDSAPHTWRVFSPIELTKPDRPTSVCQGFHLPLQPKWHLKEFELTTLCTPCMSFHTLSDQGYTQTYMNLPQPWPSASGQVTSKNCVEGVRTHSAS